jgi:hypothetical protein
LATTHSKQVHLARMGIEHLAGQSVGNVSNAKLASMKKDAEIAEQGKAADELFARSKKLIESAQSDMKSRLAPDGTFNTRKAGDAIKLKRSDARNVKTYQEAKALAVKEGVPLEIVTDQ